MNNSDDTVGGYALLVLLGLIFPPFGALLLIFALGLGLFALVRAFIGLFIPPDKPFVPDQTPDVVPKTWTKDD